MDTSSCSTVRAHGTLMLDATGEPATIDDRPGRPRFGKLGLRPEPPPDLKEPRYPGPKCEDEVALVLGGEGLIVRVLDEGRLVASYVIHALGASASLAISWGKRHWEADYPGAGKRCSGASGGATGTGELDVSRAAGETPRPPDAASGTTT